MCERQPCQLPSTPALPRKSTQLAARRCLLLSHPKAGHTPRSSPSSPPLSLSNTLGLFLSRTKSPRAEGHQAWPLACASRSSSACCHGQLRVRVRLYLSSPTHQLSQVASRFGLQHNPQACKTQSCSLPSFLKPDNFKTTLHRSQYTLQSTAMPCIRALLPGEPSCSGPPRAVSPTLQAIPHHQENRHQEAL